MALLGIIDGVTGTPLVELSAACLEFGCELGKKIAECMGTQKRLQKEEWALSNESWADWCELALLDGAGPANTFTKPRHLEIPQKFFFAR